MFTVRASRTSRCSVLYVLGFDCCLTITVHKCKYKCGHRFYSEAKKFSHQRYDRELRDRADQY